MKTVNLYISIVVLYLFTYCKFCGICDGQKDTTYNFPFPVKQSSFLVEFSHNTQSWQCFQHADVPQLTLGGLAQMDRHWDQNTKVLV